MRYFAVSEASFGLTPRTSHRREIDVTKSRSGGNKPAGFHDHVRFVQQHLRDIASETSGASHQVVVA